MGQDSGDDQWHNRHAAKPCIGLDCLFFYSPQGGSNYWLNALPAGIAKLGI